MNSLKTHSELIAGFNENARVLRVAANRIEKLPVRDVDSEVLAFAAGFLDYFNASISCCLEMNDLGNTRIRLRSENTTEDVIAKMFIDELAGTSGESLRVAREKDQELAQHMDAVLQRIDKVNLELRRTISSTVQVRARLASKFGREFPQP